MNMRPMTEIDELIANGTKLVAEAREALARSKRLFEEHNIDPEASLEFVRKHAGEAAVFQIQEQVKATILSIEQDLEQRRLHATKVRPTGKRPPRTRNMI